MPRFLWRDTTDAVSFADLKKGFLADSLRESPLKIGIADRLEAGMKIGLGESNLECLFSN